MIYPSARDLTPFTSRDFDQSPSVQGPKPSPHLAQMSSLFVCLFIYSCMGMMLFLGARARLDSSMAQ